MILFLINKLLQLKKDNIYLDSFLPIFCSLWRYCEPQNYIIYLPLIVILILYRNKRTDASQLIVKYITTNTMHIFIKVNKKLFLVKSRAHEYQVLHLFSLKLNVRYKNVIYMGSILLWSMNLFIKLMLYFIIYCRYDIKS